MNSSSKRLSVLALASLLAAPAVSAKMMEDTVATVNGSPILLSEYQKQVSEAIEMWQRQEPEALRDPANLKKLRESTLEELVNRELLYQEGAKQKIKVRERDIDNGAQEIKDNFKRGEDGRELTEAESEELFQKRLKADGLTYQQFRDRLSKQIMARKLIDQGVKAKVTPPDEKEVRAYFEKVVSFIAPKDPPKGADPKKDRKAFALSQSTEAFKGMSEEEAYAFRQISSQVRAMSSERVRVSRILVKVSPNATEKEKKRALSAADEIRRKLEAGTSTFAEIARSDSEDPESAARGGDIGYVLRGVAPPEFEKAAFSLPVGELSQPIFTEIGYNIIRVQEKRAAETPEYDRFKEDLTKFMMNMRYQKDLEAFVKGLKAKAVIERSATAVE
ncbi:MAG: peptidylprolyl isomerase [Elusimicrobia bacterium]|nr:peptidylprolyl isomerase [Elusimicrobiota bacterium]